MEYKCEETRWSDTGTWQAGHLLAWMQHVLTPSTPRIGLNAPQDAGKVAENAEDRKADKYRGLPASHIFTPIAIETWVQLAINPWLS